MTHPTPPPNLPPRCDAAEITAVLAAVAEPGSHALLERDIDPVPSAITIVTASLWRITCHQAMGLPLWTMAAIAPDGRTWQHGCQRQWLTTGEVVEPLKGLTREQRFALADRLSVAQSLPTPEPPPADQAVMTLFERVGDGKPSPVRRGRQ